MISSVERQLSKYPILPVLLTFVLWWIATLFHQLKNASTSDVLPTPLLEKKRNLFNRQTVPFEYGGMKQKEYEKSSLYDPQAPPLRENSFRFSGKNAYSDNDPLLSLYSNTPREESSVESISNFMSEEAFNVRNIKIDNDSRKNYSPTINDTRRFEYLPSRKTLVTIACGTSQSPDVHQRNIFSRQLNQTKTMLKTLVLFSKSSFKVVLVTDSRTTYDLILQQMDDWPTKYRSRLQFEIAGLWIPSQETDLLGVWRPCAWSKLFLLESLPHINSAVYVDTDILFLGPPDHLWDVLGNLRAPQAMALGPDPLYSRHKHRRYAGSVGLSTGLMVLNFEYLRTFRTEYGNFTSTVMYYKNHFPNFNDQDTLNVLLADHPEMFLELGAQWNFGPSQCIFGVLTCCVDTGVNVLHGFDATFVRGVEMIFQVVYEGLLHFDMTSYISDLVKNLEHEFYRVSRLALSSPCKKVWGIQDVIIKHMRELASKEHKSLGQAPGQR